ncbi:hypothetical protein IHE45_03G076400 [Dioscorea alata]|uniref:Uncharacterized protein n=1 Tax=Dioscorea alata TaxID=55571 RepID=A0ACB7WLV7_DIOAL|nr:hypothetical protein IHE45_03G076400 [Dioscorea alata]
MPSLGSKGIKPNLRSPQEFKPNLSSQTPKQSRATCGKVSDFTTSSKPTSYAGMKPSLPVPRVFSSFSTIQRSTPQRLEPLAIHSDTTTRLAVRPRLSINLAVSDLHAWLMASLRSLASWEPRSTTGRAQVIFTAVQESSSTGRPRFSVITVREPNLVIGSTTGRARSNFIVVRESSSTGRPQVSSIVAQEPSSTGTIDPSVATTDTTFFWDRDPSIVAHPDATTGTPDSAKWEHRSTTVSAHGPSVSTSKESLLRGREPSSTNPEVATPEQHPQFNRSST